MRNNSILGTFGENLSLSINENNRHTKGLQNINLFTVLVFAWKTFTHYKKYYMITTDFMFCQVTQKHFQDSLEKGDTEVKWVALSPYKTQVQDSSRSVYFL